MKNKSKGKKFSSSHQATMFLEKNKNINPFVQNMIADDTDGTKNQIKKSIHLLLEGLDHTVKHTLKLILKKNQQSNIKGLKKLEEILVTLSLDDILKFLTIWIKIYNKSIDDEYGYEEKILIQSIQLNLVKTQRKALDQHVDSIFIVWLLSTFDFELEAAKIAKESFCLYFDDKNLQLDSELISPFYRKISSFLISKLREVTSLNLKDVKFDYKYEPRMKKSIQLAFYILAHCSNFKIETTQMMEIIFEPKFLSISSKSKEGIILILNFFTDLLKFNSGLERTCIHKICVNTMKLLRNTKLCVELQLATNIMAVICVSYEDIAFDPLIIRDNWLKLPILLLDDSTIRIRYLLPTFKLFYNLEHIIPSYQFHKSVLDNLSKIAYKFQNNSDNKNSLYYSIISLIEKIIQVIFDTVDQPLIFQIFSEIGLEHLILSYNIKERSINVEMKIVDSFIQVFNLIYRHVEKSDDDRLLLQFIKVILAKFEDIITNLTVEYDDSGTVYLIAFLNALISKPKLINLINYELFVRQQFDSLVNYIDKGNHPEFLVYFCILGTYMIDFSHIDGKFEIFISKISKNITEKCSDNMISPMVELVSRLTVNMDLISRYCANFDPTFIMKLAKEFLNKEDFLSYGLMLSQYTWIMISQDSSGDCSIVNFYADLVFDIIYHCHPALIEFKSTLINDLIKCNVPNNILFMEIVSFIISKADIVEIFGNMDYQKLMEKWFFELMNQDTFYLDINSRNIPVILKFVGSFLHGMFNRVIDEKNIKALFFSFFSSKCISDYLDSYENFKEFISYLPSLSSNINYTILSLVSDHKYLQNVSLKVPYIPTRSKKMVNTKPDSIKTEHPNYIHKEICNELMALYVFFNAPNSFQKLKNYIKHDDFINFILDLAYITIFSDLETGIEHVISLFTKLLPDCAKNIIKRLLTKCRINAHYCVVLYYLFKYGGLQYGIQLGILKKFLLKLDCNSDLRVYNLNHLSIISVLMGLMKNDDKLLYLMNQYIIHPSIYEKNILYFLQLRSIIVSYLNCCEKRNGAVTIQTDVFNKLMAKYMDIFVENCLSTWVTQSHSDIIQIERYLGISLARHFIQLSNIFSIPELSKDYTMNIIQAISNDALIKSLNSHYDELTRDEVIMLCDIILYDTSYPKSIFQFTHMSAPLLQRRKPSRRYPQAYVEICQKILKIENLRLYDKVSTKNGTKESSNVDKKDTCTKNEVPVQQSGVVELRYYVTSSYIPENRCSSQKTPFIRSLNYTGSQIKYDIPGYNILFEVVEVCNPFDEVKVAFVDYFEIINRLSKLKTDPLFFKFDETNRYEMNPILKEYMDDSIKEFSKLTSCKYYIRQDYYFTSKYVLRDIFIATTHILKFHLFIQLMKRVSDENQLMVFGSNDVKKIILSSITAMLDKIDLCAVYIGRCESFSILDSSYLENFIYQTLLFFGMEYPLMLNDIVRVMNKRKSKQVMDFCTRYLSKSIISSQIKQCVNYFKQNKEFLIIGDFVLNQIIINSQIKDEKLEFYIRFSDNYPFEPVVIEPKTDIKAFSADITGFLKSFQIYIITHKHLSIVDGLKYFHKKLNECMNENEMCSVCFSVISLNDMSLPSKKCAICMKKFHKLCLFNWFTTSSKRSCPLCRSAFY